MTIDFYAFPFIFFFSFGDDGRWISFTPVDSRGISFSQVTPRPPGGAPQPPLSWRDNFDAERHRATGGGATGGAGMGRHRWKILGKCWKIRKKGGL